MNYVYVDMQLSVVIITLNEEKNIGRCLESVQQVADEIVVVDSGSVDNTKRVCQWMGARVFDHPFQSYGIQKDFAVRIASYDHILSLDADESLSNELADSIKRVKTRWDKDAYYFKRITNFCGKWVLHGEWYPDKVLRLFDRRKARWKGNIHERVCSDNPQRIGYLQGRLLHYSYYSMEHFYQKTAHYAALEAVDLLHRNIHPGMYHFYIKPAYRFFSAYVLQRGFLDGPTGYSIAKMTAIRLHLKFDKLKQMHEQRGNSQENI